MKRHHLPLALPLALILSSCASNKRAATPTEEPQSATPRYSAYYAPVSTPRFVTIDRDPIYTFVRDERRDLIAFRAISVADGRPTGASLTCFLNVPADAPLDTPLDLSESPDGAQGWAIVNTPNVERRVAPLTGAIILLSRDNESLTAAIDIAVADDERVPSIQGAAFASLTPRRNAIATPALTTRAGVPHAAPPPKTERRKTEAVWPWAEIMGDFPPPEPNYSTNAQPPRPIHN
ncbi:MAG: hypothetical protein AB7G17_06560 [Phycisphaerales bacterium]